MPKAMTLGLPHDPLGTSQVRRQMGPSPARLLRQPSEAGCGDGELGRRLAPGCSRYSGLDHVDTALEVARRQAPNGRFVGDFFPSLSDRRVTTTSSSNPRFSTS